MVRVPLCIGALHIYVQKRSSNRLSDFVSFCVSWMRSVSTRRRPSRRLNYITLHINFVCETRDLVHFNGLWINNRQFNSLQLHKVKELITTTLWHVGQPPMLKWSHYIYAIAITCFGAEIRGIKFKKEKENNTRIEEDYQWQWQCIYYCIFHQNKW